MKKINILLLAAISAFSMSCSKDVLEATESTTENVKNENLVPVTILIGESENTTRTTITPNTAGALDFNWKVGDMITLVPIITRSDENANVFNAKYDGKDDVTGKAKFVGSAAGGQKYVAMYPAIDPSIAPGTGYTNATGQTTKAGLISKIEPILDLVNFKQNGNNDVAHIENMDYLVSDVEFVVSNQGGSVGFNSDILFEHVFAFAKVIMSGSQLGNRTNANIELKGFWAYTDNGVAKSKGYRIQLENLTPNQDVTAWILVPKGSAAAKTNVEVHTAADAMKSHIYLRQLPNAFAIESGVGRGAALAQVYKIDFRGIPQSYEEGIWFQWGNLDGYDASNTDHIFWDNNSITYNKSEANLKSLISSSYTTANGWKGLVNSTAIQDPSLIAMNYWNGGTYVGAPYGIGDPATYYLGSDYHTPTRDEWMKLLRLQGTEGINYTAGYIDYEYNALGTPFAQFEPDPNGDYVWDTSYKKFSLYSWGYQGNPAYDNARLKLNPNGHKTAYWVAVNKDPSKNDANGVDMDLYAVYPNSSYYELKEWRVYPCGATSLSDPYLVIPILGYHSSGSFDPNQTSYWCSDAINGSVTNAYDVQFLPSGGGLANGIAQSRSRGNAGLILPLLSTTADDWADLTKTSGWIQPVTY